MTPFGRLLVSLIVIIILAIAAFAYFSHGQSVSPAAGNAATTATTTPRTYGMSEYVDSSYGFSFWYPSALSLSIATSSSTTDFPGGSEVERITIGAQGGTYVSVVQSASSTITDEPNGHAAPIAQTNYFFDNASSAWMVAYPEGSQSGGPDATTTADVSQKTIAGLPMLPSGARFDTTIIPSSTTQFIIVQDGGGSSFTAQLAATVAPANATIDPAPLARALQAESAAYANQ